MKILSAAEMREVDRLTTERYKIPSLLLMENAAVATVEAVEKKYGPVAGKRALIVCGRGNNGGDGAAIARQLWKRGCSCAVLLLARVAEARGDARTNFEIAQALAVTENPSFQFIEVESFAQFQQQASAFSCDFIFDAMFGTGLTRPVTGIYADVIRFFSETEKAAPVIAVDIPSGIASDSAELMGVALRADLTVTFTAPKVASVLPPACDYSGELVTASIGSPDELITSSGSRLTLIERDMVADWLAASRRSPHANKGDAGKVLIIAGSRGKTGAACLAGEAALRAGAGLVTIATAESAQPVIAAQAIAECMTEALAETGAGAVAREAIARALDMAKERDVLALGPGLGSSEESTRDFAHTVVAGRERPMVIDADGLNALAPWPAELGGSAQLPIILTPHPGEMARLIGSSIADVLANRVETVRKFATNHSLIVVLKGSRTLIAAPDGEVYVNPTGNAGMATGGSGDVLTGLIAGLLAQKRGDALAATLAAVYLHGLAGDIAAARFGIRAMIASDISACLGEAIIETGGEAERLTSRP